MKKRLMSLLLCLCMLITMFPTAAYAAQGDSLSTTAQTTYENTENPFVDVKKSDWFYSAVQYACEKGFFSGTSTTTFEPSGTMTRGMFVTVLGRMAGVDTANYKGEAAFSDVAADAYYAPFVAWGAKHGITSGVGNGKFAPDELINRQQMVVFFVRYFETFGVDYETGAKITTTPADIDNVEDYAKDAVLKMWKTGLMAGDGVNFNPLGNASRAQAATLCMRTDETVETWYKEPGVPKKETPVVIPPSGGSSSGDSSSGGSSTVYYGVTLKAGEESTSKLYPAGTLLNTMPVPAQENGTVFLGWYYDSTLSKMVASTDTLSSNLTLYAKFTQAVSLSEDGELNFVTKQDAAANFTITMNAVSAPAPGTDFKFRNITNPSVTDGTDDVEQETVSVTGSAGSFNVASATGSFTPGHTYQIELLNDAITFTGEREEIQYYNFIIQKDEVLNLSLSDGIKYIAASALSETDRNNVLEYAGLYQAVTDAQGVTTYTANSGTGSFTYSGSGGQIMVGDTVAVYTGQKPDERTVEDSGDVVYLEITRIDGTTYYYESAQSEDVLFTPDLLPVDLDAGDGVTSGNTVATSGTGSITISTSKLDFTSDIYADMGLNADTLVEPGDFLTFFNNGDFGDTNASKQGYGEITAITINGDSTIITYIVVDEQIVLSAMELYSENELTDEELESAYDEQLIREAVESQLMSSGFIQEAGEYLAGLAIQTDEVKEIFGSEDNLTLTDYTISYSDGTPVSEDDLALMGNIVDKEGGVKTSVSVTPRLSHFEGRKGVRVEVAVTYNFDITKSGSDKKVEVELTAFFEQEVLFGFSVSGGAVWKKKWIFPYIADYRMTGNIDLGTYTGVGVTATAKLAQDDEPWGMPWPESVKEAQAAKKIFSLSESIKKMMEDVESVFPEAEASSSGGLAEKYAAFMEDANEEWVDLFVVNLINLRGAVDPFHILAYGIQVDFVVSANLNVAIGMTFQYENSKRHSFSLSLKSKKADTETIDLSTNGYQFDFYVMGTLGIRAGIRAKALVGLFSTKLNGIGLQIEAGAYARLWGYFYYSLTNYKIKGVWVKTSSSSGALLVEIGAYLDVKFVAEVLNGKYSYAPTIYAKEWPIWSAGQRENVYDFAYVKAPTYNIQNVTTYTLPTTVFKMKWMDLKTGDLGEDDDPNTKNFDANTAHNIDDEKYFAVELSNPAFTYNPVNNQVTVSRASGNSSLSCEMKLTWKGAPLSFSTETLSRTITLKWSDVINGKTIVFESNGGSAVDMICKLAGANISALKPANPTKAGYTFAGWYTNSACTGTAYAFPNTMPVENVTLYAKWTPNVASYTVEYYQKGVDGRYVMAERQTMSGITNQTTDAMAKSYAGFTPRTIQQKTVQADGNTVVQVYYERNSYTVTFNYGAEADNRSMEIKYPVGAKIEWSNPTAPGYSFLRWNDTVPTVMPANDLTFTAVWGARTDTKYTVEHYQEDLNEGSYILTETEIKKGSSNANVTPEVKSYAGFNAPSVQTATIKGDGSTVVKYYYTRSSYTLTYVLGNGDDNAVHTIKFGKSVPQQNNPTRIGYSFGGWMENGAAASIPATMPAKDVTLIAQWNVKQFTITFDSAGGSEVAAITQNYGTAVTTPAAPTKDDYTFAGWKLNGDDYTFSTIPAENITLTAAWTASGNIAYTVEHYRAELDGSYPATTSETENLNGTTGATVTATAKSYTGFTYDSNVSSTVSSGLVTADGKLTLKLYYTRNSYTVTWNGNGVTVDTNGATTGSVKYGAIITKPTNNPTKTGYTFNQWSGYTENMTMPAADTTFTADWTANQYTITFDSNGGSEVAAITKAYGTAVTAPTAPTKENYIFAGWQLNSVNYTFTTMPAEDITLVAVWSDKPVTEYNLWIGNTRVTSGNSENVLGDNTVSYDSTGNTLTLNGVSLETAYESGANRYNIYSNGNLNIVLEGENTITGVEAASGNSAGIYVNGVLTITDGSGNGTGKLTVTGGTVNANNGAYSSSGIYSNGTSLANGGITIYNGTVIATGGTLNNGGSNSKTCGMYAYYGTITIEDGTVNATGGSGLFTYAIASSIADGKTAIEIKNGTVTAIGGTAASGCSFGIFAIYVNSKIIISGGTVTATGADGANHSVGIEHNGGSEANLGNSFITISGGTVTATGGNNAAYTSYGIRQGWDTYGFTISGGTLTMFGNTIATYKAPYLDEYSSYAAITGGDANNTADYQGTMNKYFHITQK